MKRLMMVGLALVLLLGAVACAAPQSEAPRSEGISVGAPPGVVPAPPAAPGKGGVTYTIAATTTMADMDESSGERMIVRTGDIALVVADVAVSLDDISRLAADSGGYVVSSRLYGKEEDRRGNISIRVPDGGYDSVLAVLRALAVRVESERTYSEDVTEQYVDLQSRLKNAEATEAQYLALLEKAEDVEDILRIYDSLSRVRSEIEQIKGRMQYLERTSSMSLISVNLEPEATAGGLVRAGWSALEVLKSAVRGIVVFGQWLGAAVIWLLIFSPVWGTIAGIIYWRRRKKKAQK